MSDNNRRIPVVTPPGSAIRVVTERKVITAPGRTIQVERVKVSDAQVSSITSALRTGRNTGSSSE